MTQYVLRRVGADTLCPAQERTRLRCAVAAVVLVVLLPVTRAGTAQSSGNAGSTQIRLASDASWEYCATIQPGWETPAFDDSSWSQASAPSVGTCGRTDHGCRCADIGPGFPVDSPVGAIRGKNASQSSLYSRRVLVIDGVTGVAGTRIVRTNAVVDGRSLFGRCRPPNRRLHPPENPPYGRDVRMLGLCISFGSRMLIRM